MSSRAVFAALLLVAACRVNASEEADHVVKLTSTDYDEKISDGKVYFIKFFAPWCGHCKRLAPTWSELAAEFKDSETISIAHVDCTLYKDVCSGAEIRGYPTLKVFHNGEEAQPYRGGRDLAALKSFIETTANDLLTETKE